MEPNIQVLYVAHAEVPRLGADLYRQVAIHPADGLDAVTTVAESNGLDLTGESLWLDWLAALALHNEPNAPDEYRRL